MDKKQTIVSGIRASGKLHVGNYLGALKQFVELQNDETKNCYFFIADLHGLTTPFEPKELANTILDVTASYLAAGINPEKTTFFLQSQVLEHAQLAWIFNCITPLGELYRMTQFKVKGNLKTKISDRTPSLSKPETIGNQIVDNSGYFEKLSEKYFVEFIDKEGNRSENKIASGFIKTLYDELSDTYKVNAGLLTYPALMAADILMYKADAVPVGDDQVQHVELARVVARKFNHKFGKTFPEPKTFLTKPLRIMSLTDPTKKMSKTGDEALLLDDSPAEITRKLKKALTASEAGKKSPGEENLMLLLSHFGKTDEIAHFMETQAAGTLKYSELKEALAKDISNYFADFREKKKELLARPEYLAQVLAEGSRKAAAVAKETLLEVKQKIGLL